MQWSEAITQRLDRIEARQKAYGMHDPECPLFQTEQHQKSTGAYLTRPECLCWLNGRPDEVNAEARRAEAEKWGKPPEGRRRADVEPGTRWTRIRDGIQGTILSKGDPQGWVMGVSSGLTATIPEAVLLAEWKRTAP